MKTFARLLILIAFGGLIAASDAQQPMLAPDTNGESQAVRVTRAQSETVALWQWTVGTERQLASEPGSPTASALPQAVRQAQEEHAKRIEELERLVRELAELRTAITADKETNANADKLIHEWEERLAAAKAQLAELAKREAELIGQLTAESEENGLVVGVDAGKREPVAVLIRNGFVAPLASPYIMVRNVSFKDGDRGVAVIAKQDGIPLGQALESGGWLAKELQDATPENNYVVLMISSDSIATYYGLVKELRRRKLRHTWNTWDGKSFYIVTQSVQGSGGSSSGSGTTVF